MNSLELMKCLKYLSADEYGGRLVVKIKVWENVVATFDMQVQEV
jgi:hypothetical protein